jgi:hypothetical protein
MILDQMNQQMLDTPWIIDFWKTLLHGLFVLLQASAAFLLLFAPIVAACLVDKFIGQWVTHRHRQEH